MFEHLKPLPDDPILGLIRLYREDPSSNKVDLGAGVYQDEAGETPILRAVKESERRLWESQRTKVYEGLAGNLAFDEAMTRLLFGAGHPALEGGRIATLQTTGGSGGLHIAAGVLRRARPESCVWMSTPTWPNHQPLLSSVGVKLKEYPYYDLDTHTIQFDAMLGVLEQAPAGDVVLLHGCCHNPTGADLSREQWDQVIDLMGNKRLLPFIDIAYQGFAEGVDEDAYGVRACAERLPESLVVASCSKNFGFYRDRVGVVSIVGDSEQTTQTGASHLANVTRRVYSMPPSHGGEVVQGILNDDALRADWLEELATMRNRMNGLRGKLADALRARTGSSRFDFVAGERGMFSLLGLSKEQIMRLREEYHVYMVGSSRANIAGVSDANLEYLSDAIAAVL